MCSKYDDHSKLNSPHHHKNIYDHSMSTRIFAMIMNKTSYLATMSIWKFANNLVLIACFV